MVRSRQLSNAIPSPEIQGMLKYGSGYKEKDMRYAIYTSEEKYLMSNKNKWLAEEIFQSKHVKQKGVIASQFTGFGGADSIASFLLKFGAQQIYPLTYKDLRPEPEVNEKKYPWMSDIKFAMINGRLTQEEQAEMVNLYNDKDNNHGEKLTLLLIGYEQCMGLDLKATRFTIFWELPFISFLDEQFKYRGNRKGSHLMLPKEEQNVQHYHVLSVYPEGFDPTVKVEVEGDDDEFSFDPNRHGEKLKVPTDKLMQQSLTRNASLINSACEMVEEVSIECEVVKRIVPGLNHKCKVCAPNNTTLFTETNATKSPINGIMEDVKIGDKCSCVKTKKVTAEKIDIKMDGETLTYYYIKSPDTLSGYKVYIETAPKQFEEVTPGSPIYKKVVAKI
jgi:hypothetical protein